MNYKISGRFILTTVGIIIFIKMLNLLLILSFLILRGSHENFHPLDNSVSPEEYTLVLADYIDYENNNLSLSYEGQRLLDENRQWIQVLEGYGKEVYSYNKPANIQSQYTPFDLVQLYKYGSSDGSSTIFVSKAELDNQSFTYIVGFPFSEVKRNVFNYEPDTLAPLFRKTILLTITLDIPAALLLAYLCSRKLTKPLVEVISDVKSLSEGDYSVIRKEKGPYKEIYANINTLSAVLKKNQLELEKTEQMREEWIGNNSHDIKTPLVSIKGYAEILSDESYHSTDSEKINLNLDKLLIQRVITNILYNAIIHNDKDIHILVTIKKEDRIYIEISDNGKGIRPEDLSHIFERYYRGTNTSMKHKGSGLGMAIAHDIIKAHGGSIQATSTYGSGTSIQIIL